MPRKAGKVPAYCLHKHSGQAVVRLDGCDHYLGPCGTPASHELYARLVAEWRVAALQAANKDRHSAGGGGQKVRDLTVEQMLGLYWSFAKTYYTHGGRPTKELAGMKYAMRPLRQLYGRLPARDFGPLAIKAVRQ
ncbi:MAG TPA: site-specific integrase, partial [Pirellulales bacterium]|nr:site-specific integrase [Pirellulales bacterium]